MLEVIEVTQCLPQYKIAHLCDKGLLILLYHLQHQDGSPGQNSTLLMNLDQMRGIA